MCFGSKSNSKGLKQRFCFESSDLDKGRLVDDELRLMLAEAAEIEPPTAKVYHNISLKRPPFGY